MDMSWFNSITVNEIIENFPIAIFIMNRWLDDFAYSISIHWTTLIEAGFIVLIIALLTVAYQAYMAATRNPIDSLRSE